MQKAQVSTASYKSQWATIFILLYGSKTISQEDIVKLLYPILSDYWILKDKPVVYTVKVSPVKQMITQGPWKGRDTLNKGPILTAIKWNVRKNDGTSVKEEDLGEIRSRYREKIIPLLPKIGLASEYVSARNYLTPFDSAVDKGLPANPPIPIEEKEKDFPWWYWLGGAIAGLLVLHQIGKRLPE